MCARCFVCHCQDGVVAIVLILEAIRLWAIGLMHLASNHFFFYLVGRIHTAWISLTQGKCCTCWAHLTMKSWEDSKVALLVK